MTTSISAEFLTASSPIELGVSSDRAGLFSTAARVLRESDVAKGNKVELREVTGASSPEPYEATLMFTDTAVAAAFMEEVSRLENLPKQGN